MKNKKVKVVVIILAIGLVTSIFINIRLASSHNNAKEYALSGIYSNLKNITVVLDNLECSMLNNDEIDDYTLRSLEIQCVQLDDSIYTLSSLSSGTTPYKNFKEFYKNLFLITKDYNTRKIEISDISQYKVKVEELITKLSPDEKLLKDDYDNICLNPNNSLNINQIINFIDSTLKSMELMF